MDTFLKKFGKQIKGFRELRGLTQEALAEKVDVATNTISASILKLCEALEITVEDLFSFACPSNSSDASYLAQIITLVKQLSPQKQKQILNILKTFE